MGEPRDGSGYGTRGPAEPWPPAGAPAQPPAWPGAFVSPPPGPRTEFPSGAPTPSGPVWPSDPGPWAQQPTAPPPAPWAQPLVPSPRAPAGYGGPPQGSPRGPRTGLIVVAVVAGLVLAAGGIFLGAMFFGGGSGDSSGATQAQVGNSQASGQGSLSGSRPGGATQHTGTPLDPARVGPVQPVAVTATCTALPGVDAAGNPVTYKANLTLDGVAATAWRCPGSAVGQRLVFDFGRTVTLTSVGLIPGYAKVDPVDGTNRFAENHTVTGVTWQFDSSRFQNQAIPSPSPSLAEFPLAGGVQTRRVVLTIAGTGNDTATRDFTAISEVQFVGY